MITLAVLTLSVYTSGYCQMLVWGKHGEPKITYNVYQGLQSRDYSITTFVGSDTSYKIKQNDVFFAVTAIDSAKNESQFSDEVFYSSNKPIPPYFDINANTDTVTLTQSDSVLIFYIEVYNELESGAIVDSNDIYYQLWFSEDETNWNTITTKIPLQTGEGSTVTWPVTFDRSKTYNLTVTSWYKTIYESKYETSVLLKFVSIPKTKFIRRVYITIE